MKSLVLNISYDGTDFFGWQKQNNQTQDTVQNKLEEALYKLTQTKISTMGSGRTDAGVHAKQQMVHFLFPEAQMSKYNWVKGLNRYLPESIRAKSIYQAPEGFHIVKSASSKVYAYTFQDGPTEDPLKSRYSLWVSSPLDLDYLQSLSNELIGLHDFKSFQSAGTPLATTEREILEFKWKRLDSGLVEAQIEGTGFLKQMVRNIIGTITHQYWRKSLTAYDIQAIMALKDRRKAYGTAPAKGLCLTQVKYSARLDKIAP